MGDKSNVLQLSYQVPTSSTSKSAVNKFNFNLNELQLLLPDCVLQLDLSGLKIGILFSQRHDRSLPGFHLALQLVHSRLQAFLLRRIRLQYQHVKTVKCDTRKNVLTPKLYKNRLFTSILASLLLLHCTQRPYRLHTVNCFYT